MEASHEEERRGSSLYVYHPCHYLQEALNAFFKCLGIESETPPAANSPSNTHKTSPDASDPPASTTNQTTINNASSVARRRGSRGSSISDGSGPQHN